MHPPKPKPIKQMLRGGDPSIDQKAFRQALGSFATGVTIVTSPGEDRPVGVTANSFSSVSLDPPLVLWSIAHTSRSYHAFQNSQHFAINILADDQMNVSQTFASSSDDKFSAVPWRKGSTGSPIIENAIAYFDCVCEARHEGGDHTVLIGRVVDFGLYEGEPLVFSRGRYTVAVDHPALASSLAMPSSESDRLAEFPLLSLIAKVHYKEDAGLEKRRAEAGLSPTASKVLAGLYQNPPLTSDELSRRMYLDRREVEDCLLDFVDRGDAERVRENRFTLTDSGKERRRIMMTYVAEYQAQQLSDISSADLRSARKVLEKLLVENSV